MPLHSLSLAGLGDKVRHGVLSSPIPGRGVGFWDESGPEESCWRKEGRSQ